MIDGILDLLAMIAVLGIVVPSSFGLILPVMKQSQAIYYTEIQDKTTTGLTGEQLNEYKSDGCLSYEELILTIMSQSYFMPKPRVLDICGEKLTVQLSQQELAGIKDGLGDSPVEFTPNNVGIGNWVKDIIDKWWRASPLKDISPDKLRFSIEYTLGNSESASDDVYAVYVLYKADHESEASLHRCLSGGRIESKGLVY